MSMKPVAQLKELLKAHGWEPAPKQHQTNGVHFVRWWNGLGIDRDNCELLPLVAEMDEKRFNAVLEKAERKPGKRKK